MIMLYLILVLVVASVVAGECPAKCFCAKLPRYTATEDHIYYSSVRCSSATNLTQSLQNDTRILTIVNADVDLELFLEELTEDLSNLPHINRLEFINCNLENLANATFNEEQINYLKISESKVTNLPCFNASNLTNLDLAHNQLKVLKNSFRTLYNLEVLNLSANSVSSIKEKVFSGLTTLKSLDLSNNNLSSLNDKVLIPLVHLQYLNLSNNRLEILNEACFSGLVHLQQLDVSWNKLIRVIPGNLELPSLARLLLAGNPKLGKSRKPTLLVGTGSRLQIVDASNTGLKQVPAALTHSIRILRLADNAIRSVNCGDLDSYPLLQVLDFHGNKMKLIEDDALGRLESLNILYLSGNEFQLIPRSLPMKLEVLHLEGNKIKTIQSEDLQNLIELEVLILSDNNITIIEENAFNHLLSLSSLDLSRNPISTIPAGILTMPGRLQTLRLSGISALMPVKEVAFPLTSPDYLIVLDLSNSPGLAHQLLADTAALAAARELQEVNLSESDVEYIRSDLLHYLPQLRILHLKGNPLNCSQLHWLASWMRRQDEFQNREVTCNFPPELWGTPLIDLQELEYFETTKTTRTIENITSTTPFFNFFLTLKTSIGTSSTPIQHNELNNTEDIENTTLIPEDFSSNPTVEEFIQNLLENQNKKLEDNKLKMNDSNVTMATSQLSMYSEKSNDLPHPGMLILVLGILLAATTLTVLTSQFNRRRRRLSRQSTDIEVSSIPSVTELW